MTDNMSTAGISMNKNGFLYRFLNGKGFYVALGICMIAIGVSAWTAMTSLSDIKKTDVTSSETAYYNNVSSEVQAEKKEKNVPKTSSNTSVTAEQSSAVSSKPTAKFFVFPVTGEILKDFSSEKLQYSVTYDDMRIHNGIDIAAKANAAVKSAGDGTVLSVANDSLMGYTVKIDHGNNITVVYSGLNSKTNVKKGDIVKSGTVIGTVGTVYSECLDAPHLHLECYDGKTPVSPTTLLSK